MWSYEEELGDYEKREIPAADDELVCPGCGGPSGIGLDPTVPALCHDCTTAGAGGNHHLTRPGDVYDVDLEDMEPDYFEEISSPEE